jgi:hypothetical protein
MNDALMPPYNPPGTGVSEDMAVDVDATGPRDLRTPLLRTRQPP